MPSGEDALIQRWFAPLAGPAGLGLLDDAAILSPPPGLDLVLTADAVVAGVHFFADDPPEAIARKALRVNLSDLAAKGADPLGFLMTIALPRDLAADFIPRFAGGLGADVAHYGCPLLGGDTVAIDGPLTISITALGTVAPGRSRRRNGAKAGDFVFVTGSIGDAALGLALRLDPAFGAALSPSDRALLLDRYLLPRPRVAAARAVRDHAAAAMDVSDGLAGDLAKLCAASQVGARIDIASIPLSPTARMVVDGDTSRLQVALTGGDDYEILGAVDGQNVNKLRSLMNDVGVPVAIIGEFTLLEHGIIFLGEDGSSTDIPLSGYSHFLDNR